MTPPDPGTTGEKQDTRFQPGQSGNPAGRPKGARHVALQALDAIGQERAEELLQQAITMALAGDMQAMRLLMDRVWPVAKGGRPININLPEMRTAADIATALGAIAGAAAAGELTVDEAAGLAAVIEGQRRALETVELEQRIAALEGRGGAG